MMRLFSLTALVLSLCFAGTARADFIDSVTFTDQVALSGSSMSETITGSITWDVDSEILSNEAFSFVGNLFNAEQTDFGGFGGPVWIFVGGPDGQYPLTFDANGNDLFWAGGQYLNLDELCLLPDYWDCGDQPASPYTSNITVNIQPQTSGDPTMPEPKTDLLLMGAGALFFLKKRFLS